MRHRRPRRGEDFLESYAEVLRQARDGIDLVIHTGDLFDSPNPHNRALFAASAPLLELASSGVPVVIVPGNHERSVLPGALFLSHPNIHVVTDPCTHSFKLGQIKIAVTSWPCVRREVNAAVPSLLKESGWQSGDADVRILAVHQSFAGATCGPAHFRFRESSDVIALHQIPEAFDCVLAGHVHRHQVLRGDGTPPVIYCGSTDRISFAEIDEPKGCVTLELHGGGITHEFVEHSVRPMAVCPMDVSGLSRDAILERTERLVMDLPHDAIAQIRLTGHTTRHTLKGVRFSKLIRSMRDDILATTVLKDVEWDGPRAQYGNRRSASILDTLGDCGQDVVRTTHAEALPRKRGVYALHGADGRLLYVGKAANVRARIRTHLRGTHSGQHFRGWTAQIRHMETLVTSTDLEARLLEAELIRRLQPPFNQRMRRWKKYCYLRQCPRTAELRPDHHYENHGFGPFRSQHVARQIASATTDLFQSHHGSGQLMLLPTSHDTPTRVVPRADRSTRQAAVIDFLLGRDDTRLCAVEQGLTDDESTPNNDPWRRKATLLRSAFDHCHLLSRAEALLNTVVVLSHSESTARAVIPQRAGLVFVTIDASDHSCRTLIERWHAAPRVPTPQRLPVALTDAMLLLARALLRDDRAARVLRITDVIRWTPDSLRQRLFDGLGPNKYVDPDRVAAT
jgi:DNA repair exonuclease SbcCD nuclease subunit